MFDVGLSNWVSGVLNGVDMQVGCLMDMVDLQVKTGAYLKSFNEYLKNDEVVDKEIQQFLNKFSVYRWRMAEESNGDDGSFPFHLRNESLSSPLFFI